MQMLVIRGWLALLLVLSGMDILIAQTTARLVKSEQVWAGDKHVVDTDLVRFKTEWVMACCESDRADLDEGVIRIITSNESLPWQSQAIIESPTAGKLLSQPRLVVKPDGQLMLTAVGVVPNPLAAEPLPMFGGTVQTLAWYSNDGRTWSQASSIGSQDFVLGKMSWHKEVAYNYARGCICGNSQTLHILSSNAGQAMQKIYEETVSEFFPDEASLVFVDDLGVCLMSRVGGRGESQTCLLGTSHAPFKHWKWKETELPAIGSPNSIQLADKRVLVAIGTNTPRPRKLLCQLNLDSGKLAELLEMPTSIATNQSGMTWHDGHLWISFHALHLNKQCARLAQIVVQ